MKQVKTITRYENITDKILCNICENDCYESSSTMEIDGLHAFMDKEKYNRYDTIEFDICRYCLETKIFPLFVLPVTES